MDELLLIGTVSLLAPLKVVLQGMFAKKNVTTLSDAIKFNGLIFFVAALFLSGNLFGCSTATVAYGVVFALLQIAFQTMYMEAMSRGNVPLTMMIANLGAIIPILVSILVYGEEMTGLRVLGLAFMIITLFVSGNIRNANKGEKTWFLLAFAAMLANGFVNVVFKVFGSTPYAGENASFVAWSFSCSALISVLLLTLLRKYNCKESYKINRAAITTAAAAGLVLTAFQLLYTYAFTVIEGVILFASYNALSLIFSILLDKIILRESFSLRQIASILLGFCTLVCFNI